jgi:hypothetical protein
LTFLLWGAHRGARETRVFSTGTENMDEPIVVARPRIKRLSVQQEREAVRLLAALLTDAAKQQAAAKAPIALPGAFKRVIRGPMPGASASTGAGASPHGAAKRRPSRSATKVGE